MMKRLFFRTGTLVLLAALLVAGPAQAQPQSPLVYDDPVFAWTDNRDPEAPRPSPNAFVGLQIGSARVMITYGSPGVKGRTIFGNLVSYGNLWRTGANEATTITFTLARSEHVTLRIYDVQGRLVQTLTDGMQPAGQHAMAFDAGHLASGSYFYTLQTSDGLKTRQMTLVR